MRRLAAAALAAVLVLSTALGERVTFRLSADIDPVQYPAQERKLAQGLKSLFRLLTVEGDVVASDGSFDAVLRRTSDSGVRRIRRESSASANSTSSPPSKNPPLHIRSGLCRRECADVSAGARSEKYDAASMMPAPSAISRFITLG